ncbi:MAG TPA: hypothetical protein VMU66_07950, partial [Gaiellales bacterium]|nr:hypothetical protein [Gaiellales bacterium]
SPAGSPFAYPGAVVATVTATAGWTLSVSGSGPFSDGAGHTLPIANLAWRLAGGGTYTPFATTPATVATGAATGSSGAAVALDYQLSVSYSDPSSSSPYTTSLTYIATTP